MVKVKRTRVLPFPLKYYTRVGQGIDAGTCIAGCISRLGTQSGERAQREFISCQERCASMGQSTVIALLAR